MSKPPSKLRLAIDANEANTSNRVGSNIYAFEILNQLEQLTADQENIETTVLLAQPPLDDFPQPREGWQYQIITPKIFWTQWAEPLHLHLNQDQYDVLFVTGHYAPRLSPVPYVSCVMDLAYLHYPEQFNHRDLFQLKHWTKYSVKKAKKVVTISQFSKQEIVKHYRRQPKDVIVAHPDSSLTQATFSKQQSEQFFEKHGLTEPYFLFVGTVQPRKNLVRLVQAFELLCQRYLKQNKPLPQLVIAGKIGWLADEIISQIEQSQFRQKIITPGFISDQAKKLLIEKAAATVLVGLYEGFGIPPLESLRLGTVPVVSSRSSLPEVVGQAGLQVNPEDPIDISQALDQILSMSVKKKAQLKKNGREQVKNFSWRKSGEKILKVLKEVGLKEADKKD
ncbi:MAG: glycosyltransferase [Candidatus Pacebacteria bacterium]|nr:glycosyltransferase [Candidatus Paceibacterota bacterium]